MLYCPILFIIFFIIQSSLDSLISEQIARRQDMNEKCKNTIEKVMYEMVRNFCEQRSEWFQRYLKQKVRMQKQAEQQQESEQKSEGEISLDDLEIVYVRPPATVYPDVKKIQEQQISVTETDDIEDQMEFTHILPLDNQKMLDPTTHAYYLQKISVLQSYLEQQSISLQGVKQPAQDNINSSDCYRNKALDDHKQIVHCLDFEAIDQSTQLCQKQVQTQSNDRDDLLSLFDQLKDFQQLNNLKNSKLIRNIQISDDQLLQAISDSNSQIHSQLPLRFNPDLYC